MSVLVVAVDVAVHVVAIVKQKRERATRRTTRLSATQEINKINYETRILIG